MFLSHNLLTFFFIILFFRQAAEMDASFPKMSKSYNKMV